MKSPSPLLVWKLIGLVIVGGVIAMFCMDPMKPVEQRSDGVLARKLSTLRFETDKKGIIFFGNSLLKWALPVRERSLENQVVAGLQHHHYPSEVSVVELTTGGINVWRLQALSDLLIGSKPSVIVLQSDLFAARNRKKDKGPQLLNRIAMWSGVMNLQLLGKVEPPPALRKEPEIAGIQRKKKPIAIKQMQSAAALEVAKDMWSDQTVSSELPEFIAARDFVKSATDRGIQIVIVDLPVSETAFRFATERYFHERSRLIKELSASRVIHLAFPRVLPDTHFRDYSHLNNRGRQEFLEWFLPAFAQALAENNENHS